MPILRGVCVHPDASPVAFRAVSVRLAIGAWDGDHREIGDTAITTTGDDGSWQMDLPANSGLDPTGSWYTVRTPIARHDVVVPTTVGPHDLYDCLITPPSAPSPPGSEALAARIEALEQQVAELLAGGGTPPAGLVTALVEETV